MWDFSDPVVFFAVFTIAFGVSMSVFIYFMGALENEGGRRHSGAWS